MNMLTFKKIFLITFVFMFIVNSLNAQPASFIDSLKLLPQYPDTSDIIKVVCFYTFPYGPCELDSFSINENNFEIYVNTYYNLGDAPFLCSSSDTINIGKLNSGNYYLFYYIESLKPIIPSYYIDTIDFTVNVDNGFQMTENMEIPIKIYPNPVSDNVTIEYSINKSDIVEISIIDNFSKILYVLKNKTYHEKGDYRINLNGINLSNGIYQCVLKTDNFVISKKIVVLR